MIDQPKGRIYGLDIIRAFAIISVMGLHGALLVEDKQIKTIMYSLFVQDGVAVFFVLSGFLIGGILIRSFAAAPVSFRDLRIFWYRRWMRTVPSYYLILFVLVLIHLFTRRTFYFPYLRRYLLFAQTLETTSPLFFTESWSLCVEEWYYLLFPIVLIAALRFLKNKKTAFLVPVLLLILASNCSRLWYYLNMGQLNQDEWIKVFRNITINRFDAIGFGMLAAYVYAYHPLSWHKHRTLFLRLSLLSIVAVYISIWYVYHRPYDVFSCVLHFDVLSLPVLFALPYLSSLKEGKGYVWRAVTFISLISYSMYLLNYSIVEWEILPVAMKLFRGLPSGLYTCVAYLLFWLITIALSFLVYRYFEQPVLRLRDRK